MPAINIRTFGRLGFDITDMGFGAAPIGNFLRPISEADTEAMITRGAHHRHGPSRDVG